MPSLLMHTCCGPCTAYPLEQLRQEGFSVTGLFFNPNIHPYREFRRRVRTMRQYAQLVGLPCEVHEAYDLAESLRRLLEAQRRCAACYQHRLDETARRAGERGLAGFTTTLLVSPYQDHDTIHQLGLEAAQRHGCPFLYRDFRSGWDQGVRMAQARQLYRQPYCGCIFSEHERFREGGA